jgi:hypothetical protein
MLYRLAVVNEGQLATQENPVSIRGWRLLLMCKKRTNSRPKDYDGYHSQGAQLCSVCSQPAIISLNGK